MSLPAGWSVVPLGELVSGIEAGKSFKCDERMPHDSEVGIIKVSAVTWGEYDETKSKTCLKDAAIDSRLFVRPGDFLFSRANTIDLVGACVIARGVKKRLMLSDKILRLSFRESVDPRFVLRFLRTKPGRQQIQELSTGNQLSMRNIGQDRIREIRMPVPPLDEQRRIVAKLDALMAHSRRAKDALDAIPNLLDQLRQSILAAAFRGDLTQDWRAKNHDVEPAEELLKGIRVERRRKWEEAELAKMWAKGNAPTDERWKTKYIARPDVRREDVALPSSWTWSALSDLAEVQLGQQRAPVHAEAEVAVPYIRAANITWDGLDLSDVKEMGFPNPDRYVLLPGDILLSEASGSPSEVGKSAIWRGEIPGCCYQKTLLRVRPTTSAVTSEWLQLAFLDDAIAGRFAAMAPGVGIVHLTADRMLDWPMPLAPIAEQTEIVRRTHAALSRVNELARLGSESKSDLERLEASILGKAFRGELVPQDPSDEPASAMLARICGEQPPAAKPRRHKG